MSKVLFFAIGPPPSPNGVNSGLDQRDRQIIDLLRDAGHQVSVSWNTSKIALQAKETSCTREERQNSYAEIGYEAVLSKNPCDVIYCAAYTAEYLPFCDIPVVVECSGPTLLEAWFQRGPKAMQDRLGRELVALQRADAVVVFGERQRHWYHGLLALAGADPTDPPPIWNGPSLCPSQYLTQPKPPHSGIRFLWGGGLYPWSDPTLGLSTAIETIKNQANVALNIIGGAPAGDALSLQRFKQFQTQSTDVANITIRGFLPINEFLQTALESDVAIDCWAKNAEREMAVSMRQPLYLGCGLPLIISDFMELAPLVERYNAGWLIPDGDTKAIQDAIHQAITDPNLLIAKQNGARALARDHFSAHSGQWPQILDFIAQPRKVAPKSPCDFIHDEHLFSPTERAFVRRLRNPPWSWGRRMIKKLHSYRRLLK